MDLTVRVVGGVARSRGRGATNPAMTRIRGAAIFGFTLAACTGEIVVGETAGSTTGMAGGTGSTGQPTTGGDSTGGSSGGGPTTGGGATGSTGEPATGGTSGGVKLDVGVETGGDEACVGAPDLIFLLVGQGVWSFDPLNVVFDKVVDVACPEVLGDYTSFSVARDGSIWLLSLEPIDPDLLPERPMQVTRFDPDTQLCEVVLYAPVVGPNISYDCGDVAFVSEVGDPAAERLFFHSCTAGGYNIAPGAGGLLRLDPKEMPPAFTFLATDDYTTAPLAGTGDGRIYAISGSGEDPLSARFVQIDQDGAPVETIPVPDLKIGEFGPQMALAFYGGDLYTFGVPLEGQLLVTRYDLDDDDGDGVHQIEAIEAAADPPFNPLMLTAAASPTCIPLTPPS